MKHLKNIWEGMGLISSVLSEPKAILTQGTVLHETMQD